MRTSRIPVLKHVLGSAMVVALLGNAVAGEAPARVWPTQGWQTSTPEEQGVDPAAPDWLSSVLAKAWTAF